MSDGQKSVKDVFFLQKLEGSPEPCLEAGFTSVACQESKTFERLSTFGSHISMLNKRYGQNNSCHSHQVFVQITHPSFFVGTTFFFMPRIHSHLHEICA